MDLQLVRDGYAASKYILGYVLKSDTDKASQKRFDEFIEKQLDTTQVDRHAVYKAAHVATQGRITSVNEACHLVLGLLACLRFYFPVATHGFRSGTQAHGRLG